MQEAIRDENTCWDKLLVLAKKYRKEILAYKYFLPAVRQAIEVMLGGTLK